ncbi:MAG: MgtC/SapB family protein [Verrucomicrobiaceae bacterium]|nr:MgtC/SapB family protein [Verrucomicrobiaceae bacterium]
MASSGKGAGGIRGESSRYGYTHAPQARPENFANGDPAAIARALNGVITGVGFIGGGAILKGHGSVRGLSTVASIWCMGAIGAAVALERLVVAVTIMLITFTIMRSLAPLVESGDVRDDGDGEE